MSQFNCFWVILKKNSPEWIWLNPLKALKRGSCSEMLSYGAWLKKLLWAQPLLENDVASNLKWHGTMFFSTPVPG